MLFIGGRSGVGKSSVAFELHWLLSERRIQHAVIEGDNLDLAYPAPWEHGLAERNLQAMWQHYRDLGYRRLIYTNTVSVLETAKLAAAMGDDPLIRAVLLRATDPSAQVRLEARETETSLEAHLGRSRQRALELDRDAPPWVRRIDTDGKSIVEVAAEVLALLDWTAE